MYSGHALLSMCLSVRGRMPTLLHRPGCNLGGMKGGALPVVCFWADLQLVHGFRCCGTNTKCQRVIVLALCLVTVVDTVSRCGIKKLLMLLGYRPFGPLGMSLRSLAICAAVCQSWGNMLDLYCAL